jgi:DNA-binding response OmpR family regulator
MPKIAVIEDDHSVQQMYEFKLSFEGFDVQCAGDGESGYELCERFKPDLLLLDLRMPRMNGDEMLKKIRETDWGSAIRVIILTNASKSEAPSSLRFLHVERYIVKAHHTPKQVLEVVHEVLGSRKSAPVQDDRS